MFIDGEPNIEYSEAIYQSLPHYYRSLPLSELLYLSSIVDPSKSAGDISLPFNLTAPTVPMFQNDWGINIIPPNYSVNICPATLRPWSKIPGTMNETWKTQAMKRYGNPKELLSTYKYFEDFVFKYNNFPSNVETFLVFIYNREVICVDYHTTLPKTAYFQAKQTLLDYEKVGVGKTIDVTQYKEIVKDSRNIEYRERIEANFLKL